MSGARSTRIRPRISRLLRVDYGWLAGCLLLIMLAEIGLRIPGIAVYLPDPVPRLWHSYLVQDKLDYMSAMERSRGVDVLFMGNSTTQAAVNPLIFDELRGVTDPRLPGSFNGAIEGVPPFGNRLFLSIFLKQVRPETIIYGITPQDLNSNSPWAQEVTERIIHSPMTLAQAGHGPRGQLLSTLLRFSYLYRYRTILLHQLMTGGNSQTHLEDVYFDERGHDAIVHSLADIPSSERGYLYNNAGVVNYAAGGEQFEALVSIIEQCSSAGIELILVNIPLADDYYDNFDNEGDYQIYLDAVAAITDKYNVLFWDLENLSNLHFRDEEFADFNHLNSKGADRLTKILGEYYLYRSNEVLPQTD